MKPKGSHKLVLVGVVVHAAPTLHSCGAQPTPCLSNATGRADEEDAGSSRATDETLR